MLSLWLYSIFVLFSKQLYFIFLFFFKTSLYCFKSDYFYLLIYFICFLFSKYTERWKKYQRSAANDESVKSWAMQACHRILIYLGDLGNYHITKSKFFFLKAVSLNNFEAIFYCVRMSITQISFACDFFIPFKNNSCSFILFYFFVSYLVFVSKQYAHARQGGEGGRSHQAQKLRGAKFILPTSFFFFFCKKKIMYIYTSGFFFQ